METSKTCQMRLFVEEHVSLHHLGGEGSSSVVAQAASLGSAWCEGERPAMLIAHKTCHFTSKEYLRSSKFFDAIGNIYQFPQ